MNLDWLEPSILAAGEIPLGNKDVESLHKQGIRAIVTLTEKPLTIQKTITAELVNELGLVTLHVPIVDQHPPRPDQVWTVVEFIDQMRAQGKPVYLHCHAGVGRTGTMLHAYYLAKGARLSEAQAKVKAGRPASQFIMLADSQKAFLVEFAHWKPA